MPTIQKIAYLNELGRRENLEDTIYPKPGSATIADTLFMVCDGVGGESKGEVASQIATEEFSRFFERTPPPAGVFDAKEYINNAQQHVLGVMSDYSAIHPEATRMSTTFTLAYISGNSILAAWCGDSRIYHLRNGVVQWRSTDHSLVAQLVEQGEISEEEAATHPQRNVIIRSLSANGRVSAIDTKWIDDIRDDDYIMLCSDGVLEQINEDRLQVILTSPDPDKGEMFLKFCQGNTSDNFSLYLINLGTKAAEKVVEKPAVKPVKKRPLAIPAILLFVLIIAMLLFFNFNKEIVTAISKKQAPSAQKAPIKITVPHNTTEVIMPTAIKDSSKNKKQQSAPAKTVADTSKGVSN
jgi:serine/threonine protein phosphatase PrpC